MKYNKNALRLTLLSFVCLSFIGTWSVWGSYWALDGFSRLLLAVPALFMMVNTISVTSILYGVLFTREKWLVVDKIKVINVYTQSFLGIDLTIDRVFYIIELPIQREYLQNILPYRKIASRLTYNGKLVENDTLYLYNSMAIARTKQVVFDKLYLLILICRIALCCLIIAGYKYVYSLVAS